MVLNKLSFFPAETQEAISEEVAGGSGLCAVAIMGTETVTHPPLASLEEGWLHQHKASRGSAGVQGREDSSPVTQQMAGLALQPEAGVPSLDGVKDRSERARKEHDHVLLRPIDTRCPGEGHSSHYSPRTAAEAAQTSLCPPLKDRQLLQNCPKQAGSTVPLDFGRGVVAGGLGLPLGQRCRIRHRLGAAWVWKRATGQEVGRLQLGTLGQGPAARLLRHLGWSPLEEPLSPSGKQGLEPPGAVSFREFL